MINNTNNTVPTTTTPQVDPGYAFETAFDLGVADNGLTVNEAVGGTDEGDVYAFSVTEAGLYNVSLDGLVADADLMLIDSQRQVIDFSIMEGSESELISAQLTPGNYYAIAETYDGEATNYTLNINSDPLTTSPDNEINDLQTDLNTTVENVITPQVDPGFTFETAFDLGVADNGLTVNETVGATDEGDIFTFSISEGSLYNISLDGMTADTDLVLTDSQGQAIDMSQMVGAQGELITAQLAPGDYYAIAQSYDLLDTNYTLNIADVNQDINNNGDNIDNDEPDDFFLDNDWWNIDNSPRHIPQVTPMPPYHEFIPDYTPGGWGFTPDYTPDGIGGGIDHETFIQEVIWEREEVFDPNTNTTTWVDASF